MEQNNKKVLPRAFSLIGTNHLPTIDNQGAIGSCASQAVTRTQFSNAVSRYKHLVYGDSTETMQDPDNAFAPKYTYNFSGPGNVWVYETLRDHGALTVGDCKFDYSDGERPAPIKEKNGKLCENTPKWHVGKGEMKKALMHRVKSFEQVWVVNEPYNERLTTCPEGRELIDRIKESVINGNTVVTGGYPVRWVFSNIVNTGTYGKPGDKACVSSKNYGGGGHVVAIVGYDDDITAEYAGVTMQGAFIIANSYSEKWHNEGYAFFMYDSVNGLSEFPELNDSKLYSGQNFLTPSKGLRMFTETLTESTNQIFCIDKCGTVTVGAKELNKYYIKDKETGKFVSYNKKTADGRNIYLSDEATEVSEWSFIGYDDLKDAFESYNSEEYKEEFKGSYWIYAVNREDEAVDGQRILDAGTSFAASDREVNLASVNSGRFPVAKSWDLTDELTDSFESKLGIKAGKDLEIPRTWALDQFCFMDWDKDIILGLPELYFDLEIEAADRECFHITLTRTDKKGRTKEYMPALFRYGKDGCHPNYLGKHGKYLTFSGKVDGEPETGYFTLSFARLLEFDHGHTAADYTWGFKIEVEPKNTVKVKNIALYYGGSETPLKTISKAKTVKKSAKFTF